MTQRNLVVSIHSNGSIFTDVNEGFSFSNTNVHLFKIHINSDFHHLKDRIEKKLQSCVEDIIYRHPLINGDDDTVFYVMAPIENDEDVKSMFQCHIPFSQLPTIEIYVRLLENLETYPTQSIQSQQYGMSQTIDEEPTQNNEPFIPNEEVSDNSEDDQEDVRFEDLFGVSDDDGNEDIIDTSTVAPRAQPISLYNPHVHMQNISLDDAEPISIFGSFVPIHNADEIEEGIEFENKEVCVVALQQWHIKRSLDYSVTKYDNVCYVIKCINSTCNFKCKVSLRKGNSKWRVGKSGGPHTCTTTSMSQDHTKPSLEMISKSIMELVNHDASLKVKVIIAHIAEKYRYIISYRKAWIAKCKTIESLYGNWETSYNDLPQWILVDGTWLYGKYRGTLLMVVAQDGNGNIFPIAFVLVESETKDAWSFFLRNLRIHVTPQANLCPISYRHESIKSAYNNPENGWQYPPSSHVYCIRHIGQNFTREIKDKELCKIVVNMGYALTEAKFNYYRGEIRRTNNKSLSWIYHIPREKWAMAFDGEQRWGHMTTNLAEAMNSVLKETRNLPITALVKSTYYLLGSLFGKRGHQWTKMLASGQVFTDNCNKGMIEEVSKANTHNVMQFDCERFYFMVQEKINQNDGHLTGTFSIDLRKQHCDCGKF
ncbi:uncharacterized protein LOC127079592 [Lathyrus oleraceus]|uniref:uncharacterized protein LOC127079592 n=1 Tax=Pisum sativum TaxID=3888 RepID=UPI0021D3D791|nr:uncharacterized protein LOC127079592 [Pisum sativum]